MWRSSFLLLKRGVTSEVVRPNPLLSGGRKSGFVQSNNRLCACLFSSSIGGGGGLGQGEKEKANSDNDGITFVEAKKLMRLVNVEALKMKLSIEGKETICYSELLESCESGVEEAKEFVKVLDEAGVVLIFRDKVYLHPDKVLDLVRRAVPLALTPEDDPRREELRVLQAKQEEIDTLAHNTLSASSVSGLVF